MKLHKNSGGKLSLSAALAMCLLLGLVSGCSMFGKKEATYFEEENEWVQDMRERIADSIEDKDKKTEMLAIIDRLGEDLIELAEITIKLYADFVKLDDSYYSTPEDYQQIISEFESDLQKVHDRIIDRRFTLIDLTTPEEWDYLTDPDKHKSLYRIIIKPVPKNIGGTS